MVVFITALDLLTFRWSSEAVLFDARTPASDAFIRPGLGSISRWGLCLGAALVSGLGLLFSRESTELAALLIGVNAWLASIFLGNLFVRRKTNRTNRIIDVHGYSVFTGLIDFSVSKNSRILSIISKIIGGIFVILVMSVVVLLSTREAFSPAAALVVSWCFLMLQLGVILLSQAILLCLPSASFN